ncbi:MAG TPA: endonuclease/exonuclease/phosphatase family protein, partial [Euzebyales bacterium]|nr:endonuclease/exonuclease/phosphatase family protein [Euzebyales bacterium]
MRPLPALTTVLVRLAAMVRAARAGAAARVRGGPPGGGHAPGVRFATYNASLNRAAEGGLRADLLAGDEQARKVAQVIAATRPDVLLLNEFDHDPEAARVFADVYLGGAYRYRYADTCNTGVGSGLDLNADGVVGTEPGTAAYANDALGFGFFPGQFCMLVLSKFPIDTHGVRTFQHFRWADMPGALLPDDPGTPEPADFYSAEELAVLPLSSKSHWDVPVRVGRGRTVHFLVSHPTPPTFDGPEDRNGTRNHDEIRFWADYISPRKGRYIVDDGSRRGGLKPGAA